MDGFVCSKRSCFRNYGGNLILSNAETEVSYISHKYFEGTLCPMKMEKEN